METPPSYRKRWFRLRNILIGIALVIAGVTAWVAIEVWRLSNAEPLIAVNYRERFRQESMQLAGITAEEGERSWALMSETVKMASDIQRELRRKDSRLRFEGDHGGVDFDYVRMADSLPDDIQLEREALRLLGERGFFDGLQRFEASPPGLSSVKNVELMMVASLDELTTARVAGKVLAAHMRIEAAAGNSDEAVRRFAQMLALARTISLQPGLVCGLVALAIDALALDEIGALLVEHDFTVGQCESILSAMERHSIADLTHVLQGERFVFYDWVQRVFSDDGTGNGYVLAHAAEVVRGGPQAPSGIRLFDVALNRFYQPRRQEVVATYDAFMDGLLAEVSLSPSQRWKRGFDRNSFVSGLSHRYATIAVIVPAIGKSAESWEHYDQRREATRLMLRLAMYKAKNGRYPAELAPLVPAFLSEIPRDSRFDTAWGYRLLSDDEHNRPYVLYSFGVNGKDDGGVYRSDDGRPLSDREKVTGGIDLIMNPVRRSVPSVE